jgi:branched-chain amino acid transport system substrate-binding protein
MRKLVVAVALAMGAPLALAQVQGVSKNEIVLGTAQDMSGPAVPFSKPAVNGMKMRIDEINDAGGIHGRKLKLVVEDHSYDPKKAVLAANKLTQKDKIFAVIGPLGTPTNLAAMPIYFEKNVPHLFPLSAAREMFEPLHKLKYSTAATYYEQIHVGLKRLVKEKGYKKVCTLYQDDDFGIEIARGGEQALKELGMTYTERTTYKRGATDFSSQVQKMQSAGCEIVALGTIIRETIGAIGTARKLGWNPDFLGTTAAYLDLIHKLGGPAMNGFYTMGTMNYPYPDDPSANVRKWYQQYKEKFKEDPNLSAVYGYQFITLFQLAAEKAGPNLTVDSLVKSLDSIVVPRDMFGADEVRFTPKNHLGTNRAKLCQIQNQKWVCLTDYITE